MQTDPAVEQSKIIFWTKFWFYWIINFSCVYCTGQSCLHMVESWKSSPQLASQRLPAIHFLVHNCGASINIQVTV